MNRNDLKAFKHKKTYIEAKIRFLQEQETRIYNITQNIDGMPKAQNKTSYEVEDFFDRKNELLKNELQQFEQYQNDLYNQLDQLEPIYSTILQENYINGKSLEEVSTIIHYSYYQTCRMNGEALNEFDKLDKNAREQKRARFRK